MISKYKEALLQQVVNLDMEFFAAMKTEEPVPENTLPALRRMRWMTYSVLSEKTLSLLLRDLEQAKKAGRNTMIEKYALLEDQIPMLQNNSIIEAIAAQEEDWMEQVAEKYPHTLQGHVGNKTLFKRYMMCELQSWNPDTISSYWEDIQNALKAGYNLAEIRYDNLYCSLGKGTLKEFDAQVAGK